VIESATLTSYTGPRRDVIEMLTSTPRRLLDVGCSNGALAKHLTEAGVETWGIEVDASFGAEAQANLSHVLVGDAKAMTAQLVAAGEQFDAVICADVLEHTVDPWAILHDVHNLVVPDGEVIVSLPNVRFFTTLVWLAFRGRWRYEDRGVHDRTHLRWFTDLNARDMFVDTGFRVAGVTAHYRFADAPDAWQNRLVSPMPRLPRALRDFFVYQNVYRLKAL
jgi:2-polyprenyl-3-methyl-5-hydroxy-6-metoxy-1,4-benzoquinol methylase